KDGKGGGVKPQECQDGQPFLVPPVRQIAADDAHCRASTVHARRRSRVLDGEMQLSAKIGRVEAEITVSSQTASDRRERDQDRISVEEAFRKLLIELYFRNGVL